MADDRARERLQRVLRGWRENLLDLSGQNRLLNFRHTRTATLDITEPSAARLLDGLGRGWRFAPLPEDESPDQEIIPAREFDGILTQKSTRRALDSALRKLYRDSSQVFNDTGLWVLQLGVGMLKWRENETDQLSAAALLLVPVQLERLGPGDFRLVVQEDEEAAPNPALAVRMAGLGLAWPAPDDMGDLATTLAAVREAVTEQPGWQVTEEVVLATFHSHKEAMYRDLLDNEELILASPLVQAIGLKAEADLPDDALYFEPIDLNRIDELQPPEDTPLVLDADSSQRQCIAAAVAGKSFVMDGPPGTGKSQAIANMIATLMHAGKTILFVSEKAAALDVVRNRLEAVGLESFLLSLHSHHASRKQVATELGKSLSQQPQARKQTSREERERLRELRGNLSAYADAMNESRAPLDRSLHEVLGRLAQLRVTALSSSMAGELTANDLQHLVTAARDIGVSWRPITEGDGFAWRDLDPGPSPFPALHRLAETTDALVSRLETHDRLLVPLEIDQLRDTGRVLQLLDATEHRPPIPLSWLTSLDLGAIQYKLTDFVLTLRRLNEEANGLGREIGPAWDRLPALPPTAAIPFDDGVDLSALTVERFQRLRQEFQDEAALLIQAEQSLFDLAAAFGMPEPETLEQALALCELAELSQREPRAEASWILDTTRAQNAARQLELAMTTLTQARVTASDLFSEKVLTASRLREIAQRFTDSHHGLGKLSGAYRNDKKVLAELTINGGWSRAVGDRVHEAVAWQEAQRHLEQTILELSPDLGGYWQGDQTDFQQIKIALGHARRVAVLSTVANSPQSIIARSTVGTPVNEALTTAAIRVGEALAGWRSRLVPAPVAGGRPRLAQRRLGAAARWYEAQLVPLADAERYCLRVKEVTATVASLTLSQYQKIVARIVGHREHRKAFLGGEAAHLDLLGELYAGLFTDMNALQHAFQWTEAVRSPRAPLPEEAAIALLEERPDGELHRIHSLWSEALGTFVELFASSRRSELLSVLSVSAAEVSATLRRLMDDAHGPDEWRTFQRGLEILRGHGVDDLVPRAMSQGVQATDFSAVVERSLLEYWVEQQLGLDIRLSPARAVERDRLVAEFQKLDIALVENTHAQVIEACNARRPRSAIGQTAILSAEANKKTRHKPVRLLLEQTSTVVPLLKPCFMMSPLTVSQFLPPGYRFDVVIFDEASQVLPEDAVNCVYRGDSLIVAGDENQLPPTNYFAHAEELDDEYDEDIPDSFESLLVMCKGSGLIRSLPLRWHYRSRHEDLIAFSNRRFYESKMVTFPGNQASETDAGVTFTKVDGIYERGRSRQNPIEARAVAGRVLWYAANRPDLTVGVVAMSATQADAIEDAVDEARRARPGLDSFFSEGRLDGFFIKNLETVQGDERDVIILSVGYGPDHAGTLTMGFGPLIRKDGWRRLNVAVTRARQRVEVIASMTGADIREGDNISRNHFKRYLDYAESGPATLAQQPLVIDAAPESPFEESVLDSLLTWGYDVQPQVGVGAYRIDMAIRSTERPGRFVLGIECDGAMYHSSRTARDRDRLREEVLIGLGWRLHRIWGTDWYRNRPAAETHLREAIEAVLREESVTKPPPPPSVPDPVVNFVEVPQIVSRDWAAPYVEAQLRPVHPWYEMHTPEARPKLTELVLAVLEIEAPISRQVLYRLVGHAWGVERIGSRIHQNLDAVLAKLTKMNPLVTVNGEFVYRSGTKALARHPAEGGLIRKIGEIPPVELRTALLGIVSEAPGISERDLITEASRFFGWQRRGAEIADGLGRALRDLERNGKVAGYPERIQIADG